MPARLGAAGGRCASDQKPLRSSQHFSIRWCPLLPADFFKEAVATPSEMPRQPEINDYYVPVVQQAAGECTSARQAIMESVAERRVLLTLQNTSHAVMSQRKPGTKKNGLDDFPTPPWATRALAEYVIPPNGNCLEPACGRGHMSATLAEYFDAVTSSDIADYGYGAVAEFLKSAYEANSFDWVITNPPFNLAEKFIARSMKVSRMGVAMLTRTVFIESKGRYERLFKDNRPSRVAQFVERVPMVEGRLDRDASTATGYAWLVWQKEQLGPCELVWIPPCRKMLERDKDYDLPPNMW